MRKYFPGCDVGSLEHWPFENPLSDYRILDGNPIACGRIDQGGVGHQRRFGIWQCTKGVFECTEQGDELMTILKGRCRITDQTTGESQELGVSDSLYLQDQHRVTWTILEDVTKVFLGWKSDGY